MHGYLCALIISFTCWGCNPTHPDVKYRDVEEFSISAKKTVISMEEKMIKSFMERTGWKWEKAGDIYIYRQRGKGGDKPLKGDTIAINYVLMLLDGRRCDTLYEKNPLIAVVGGVSEPRGLNDVLMELHYGECAWAIVPSFLGYGFFGDPPCIPAHAPLLYRVCIHYKRKHG